MRISSSKSLLQTFSRPLSLFQYCGRAVRLVWTTHRLLTLGLALLTLLSGLLPGAIAYLGKLIVDGVIQATQSGLQSDRWRVLEYLGIEAIAVALLSGSQQMTSLCQSLLRVLLGQKVNVLILEKALTLDMAHFEDSEFYDKMSRARREASTRPLGLVIRTFGLIKDTLSIIAYGALLLRFSSWAVLLLMVAAIPAFVAETRFSQTAFRLFRRRTPEARSQDYLEFLISNESNAMEVKLYQLGDMLLDRYRAIFNRLYAEDRDLTIRRSLWSYGLSLISTVTFYGTYVWIVLEAIASRISLGDLTLYLVVFRQGQSTFASILTAVGGMYEDSLYLSNLYEFLEEPVPESIGYARYGAHPEDGIRFEQVSFTYPGSAIPALHQVSFHLPPGQKLAIVGKNGSGKTTLIKLLTRLYPPDSGRILLDGRDLQEWDIETLQKRIGVIFQNFVRYQFQVGENVGVGDVEHLEDQLRWEDATQKGTARSFIDTLPNGFQTQLGRWFKDGRELSGGQWQKIALSRAFMRTGADILVLDEPTSAVDAEAEVEIFNQLRAVTQNQMAILISHRFSTVRMADQIVVLVNGEIQEQGTHEQLMQVEGQYAKLFALQAAGYR
ncbi:MAG: ABC transporter ATP-binding protein/permease [Drouetiella hepatica Uher 2000/2452]|jgi:ABC-type multidrug transport system fused ATPase/permease subunit|uniref:ABC transporter ATP-binding protein/permease n=1 Tax=Drouetiella hepatica Uher 2000/2452 TaxID=904376 RepID=A0A951UKL5_9CYAN|nr:ABC transporter ATP-binding protein/permease [Drouetiella hepatica Uher 2000/2452]